MNQPLMTHFKRYLLWIGLIALVTTSLVIRAEEEWHFPPYDIYANVVSSNFLEPDTASKYQITRAKDRSLVILSIRKQLDDGSDQPQRAAITGSSSDLIHTIPLDFQEIDERDAIYYIASLRFIDQETHYFTINITIDDDAIAPQTVKFRHQLHTEP